MKTDFETALARLEEINALMSNPETSFDTSLELYREAAQLAKNLNESIEKAKLEIQRIDEQLNS